MPVSVADENWQKISLILPCSFAQKTSFNILESQYTQHCKKYIFSTQQKTHSVYKFFWKRVFGWCQKEDLHCTISRRPRTAILKHWEGKYLYIFLHISVKKLLFQRRMKLLSGGGLNNVLKAACYLGLVKCFKIFHFNWNFQKLNYTSAFWYFHQ